MNGTEPKIEIFKPFSEAFELMKKILFQPFDLGKWCVIGLAAFLANLSGGFNFNFNFWNPWDHGPNWTGWNQRGEKVFSWEQMPVWLIVSIVVAGILILAIVVLLMWIGSRGRFIFTDCIVRNRAAIVAPWREFRREGNSFFLFSLLVGLVFVVIALLVLVPLFLPGILHWKPSQSRLVVVISGFVSIILIIVLLALAWALVSDFMTTVMYRRRCFAREAFGAVVSLIATYPGEIVLYCLFLFVLALASTIIGCVSICATCCIAAIPYVGTVILLPIFVLFRSFSLMFLRQFGPDYDVWANAITPEPPPLPPIQT